MSLADFEPTHFKWRADRGVAVITLKGAERKKPMLGQEWSMSLEQAIEAEAQAQAICMQTRDFKRAYEALIAKQNPRFAGD